MNIAEYPPPVPRPPSAWYLRVLRYPVTRLVIGTFMIFSTVVAAVIVVLIFSLVLTGQPPSKDDIFFFSVNQFAQGIAGVGAYILFVLLIEWRRVDELAPRGALREFLAGAILGTALICAVVGIQLACGAFEIEGFNSPLVLLAPITLGLASGFFEESLARGVWFRILEEWAGSWIGLTLSALFFGLVHLLNKSATLANCLAISLEGGLLLAAAFMLTRRLWMAIGIHASWNFAQGGIFGAKVSGLDVPGLIQLKPVGPEWLTGGPFGPEGSVVALILGTLTGACVLALAIHRGHWVALPWNRPRPVDLTTSSVPMAGSASVPFAPGDAAGIPPAAEYQPERPAEGTAEDRPDIVDEV
jgi:membrane protease YdiL (CAAX protease family)